MRASECDDLAEDDMFELFNLLEEVGKRLPGVKRMLIAYGEDSQNAKHTVLTTGNPEIMRSILEAYCRRGK